MPARSFSGGDALFVTVGRNNPLADGCNTDDPPASTVRLAWGTHIARPTAKNSTGLLKISVFLFDSSFFTIHLAAKSGKAGCPRLAPSFYFN